MYVCPCRDCEGKAGARSAGTSIRIGPGALIEPCRDAGYACQVRSDRTPSGFKLIEIDDPGILASLQRVDAMSDEQIRDLVRGEPQIIVDAAEYLIADRHRGISAARHDS